MSNTIKITTPYNTYYLKDYSDDEYIAFRRSLSEFLLDENMAFFNILTPEGELLLPFNSLTNSEITIY